MTFYAFPKEHWKHLRTTNVVESPFATVRLRTAAAKRFKKVENAPAAIWKTVLVAVALLPAEARTAPEWAAGALFAVLVPAALWFVATTYWRGNALAFVLGVGIASGLGRCLVLLEQPNDRVRAAASVALVVMAAVLGLVAWRASAHGRAAPAAGARSRLAK